MQLLHHASLKPYNTFSIDAAAEYLIEIKDIELLEQISNDVALPTEKHIIGGGSNILLTKDIKGLTILNRITGISTLKEDEDHVWLEVNSGVVWHDFVLYAIANNWAGIENLSLIPGTVGAAPMQNIGAYGVEAKETIETVNAWHWENKVFASYNNAECKFGYRDSIFKHALKEKLFITSVIFKLNKKPKLNISYGAIGQELEKMHVTEVSIKAISDAVITIRTSKLPDPKIIGNAGSFFKNPTISIEQFKGLTSENKQMPSYPVSDSEVKIPAGWLIEQCGWKGYRKGDIGVHAKQALVLVNYGAGKGNDIWELSQQILDSVQNRFGILLEREVQVF